MSKEKIVEENLENAEEFLDIKENKAKPVIITIIILLLLGGLIGVGFWQKDKIIDFYNSIIKKTEKEKTEVKDKDYYSEYRMDSNSLEKFDLYFLQLENNKKNMVYSPLSIKYALSMLKEGTDGASKEQLSSILGDYKSKKYLNNNNISFANGLFIKDNFKDKIKEDYINTLSNKYNASVMYDPFTSSRTINDWVSNKTFKLIPSIVSDDDIVNANFYLTNALAIDINWKYFIQCTEKSLNTDNCKWNSYNYHASYAHEKYYNDYISALDEHYPTITFNNINNTKALRIGASINNYNIVKEVGEDNIRKIVGDAYEEWLNTEGKYFINNPSPDGTGLDRDSYLNKYIKELDSNYNKNYSSTDFSMFINDDVKVFRKDLKEVEGTSLQYIGIMPEKESLDKFIESINPETLKSYINQLKDISNKNFKQGVITKVKGLLPIFQLDYQLDLMNDLKELGIKDVFDLERADLSNITDEKEYIFDASHKTSFEFSTEGIKGASVTMLGGAGASSGGFQYDFDVPIEEINITFDKPFLFLVRDKVTGEIWFTGTVYEGIKQ